MGEQTSIRIALADDHPLFLDGLVSNIEAEPGFQVVARATNGRDAVEMCLSLQPDVILMDLRMPVMNGVDAIKLIMSKLPDSRIIVLTTYDGDEDIHRALKAGAKSYLLKDVFREELITAIRSVHGGGRHLPATVAERLATRSFVEELTERELQVLALIARGRSNRDIGESLSITEGTVKAHVNNILNKLNANDRTEAAMLALRRGLLHLE